MKKIFLLSLAIFLFSSIQCSAQSTSSQDFIRIPITMRRHLVQYEVSDWKNLFAKPRVSSPNGILEFEILDIDNDNINNYITNDNVFNKYNPVKDGIYEDGYVIKTDTPDNKLYHSCVEDKLGNVVKQAKEIYGYSHIRRIGNGVYIQTILSNSGIGDSSIVFTTNGDVLYSGDTQNISDFINGSAIIGNELIIDKREVPVVYNNSFIITDEVARIVDDRTVIPLRSLAEALGYIVEWDESQNKIYIKKYNSCMELRIGEDKAILNNEENVMQIPPYVHNDTTFVLLRDISEMLEFNVEWNSTYNMAFINKK